MENMEIPGRIQMERFIRVDIFGKKVIPFEVLPFSHFYRNDRNFQHCLFGLLKPGFMSLSGERKWKNYQYFFKWYNSIPFLFSVPKKIPIPFDRNFLLKFADGKHSLWIFEIDRWIWLKSLIPEEGKRHLHWWLHVETECCQWLLCQ